ncbi:MAG: DMT family transporter [Anaerotardibacter sp.]
MVYKLLIVAATVIWGSSFVIVKDVTSYISPAWILFIRFLLAALILALVFWQRRALYFKKEYIVYGCLFGLALGTGYYLQTVGIQYTTPGKNAFLTGTYCVMVPFLAWAVTHYTPTKYNLVAAFLCIVGVGFISLNGEAGVNIGDFFTLACAVFYAIHIVLVSKFSQGRDIFVLTMWQFAMVAVMSLVIGIGVEKVPENLFSLDFEQYLALAYLAVACTTIALLFQNVGQANVPPASASLLLSLESPFGVAFSVALGVEVLTGQVVIGFVLVFVAILVSEVLPDKIASLKSSTS